MTCADEQMTDRRSHDGPWKEKHRRGEHGLAGETSAVSAAEEVSRRGAVMAGRGRQGERAEKTGGRQSDQEALQ
jgi:hypothetical protein